MRTVKATYMAALLLALASGGAFASVDAGRVQFVFGNSKALAENGAERVLKKGDVVHEGDTVITGPSASLQLLMVDDAMVAVRPNSRLRIDTYRFQGKEDGSERGVLHLIKGAFRSITGAIGHTNKKNYKIITDTANIGIRGTDHEPAYLLPSQANVGDPGTYDMVNSGGTYVQTPWGTVNVSPNQVGFASSEPGSVPVLLQGVPGFMRASPPMAKDADASGSDQPERVVGLGSDNPASLEEPWLNSEALSYLTDPTVVTTALTLDDVETAMNFPMAGVYGDVTGGVARNGAFTAERVPAEKFFSDTAMALAASDPTSKLIYNRAKALTVAHSDLINPPTLADGTVINWGIYGTGSTVKDQYSSGAGRSPDYMQVMGALATPDAVLANLTASYTNVAASTPIISSDPTAGISVGGQVDSATIQISAGMLTQYQVGATDNGGGAWSGSWSTTCPTCPSPVSLRTFADSGVKFTSASGPSGAATGQANGQVVGPTAQGVISSFSLQSGSTVATGSFALEK